MVGGDELCASRTAGRRIEYGFHVRSREGERQLSWIVLCFTNGVSLRVRRPVFGGRISRKQSLQVYPGSALPNLRGWAAPPGDQQAGTKGIQDNM